MVSFKAFLCDIATCRPALFCRFSGGWPFFDAAWKILLNLFICENKPLSFAVLMCFQDFDLNSSPILVKISEPADFFQNDHCIYTSVIIYDVDLALIP